MGPDSGPVAGVGSGTLHVRLLGHPVLSRGGAPLDGLGSGRLWALLGYLVLHRDAPVARQQLAFVFWPDSSEAQARTNLRHALHDLRRVLPEPDRHLRVDGPGVQWRPDSPAVIDVAEFEASTRSGLELGSRPLLEQAASRYTGPLLPGCYDDWAAEERRRLERLHAAVLERLIALCDAQGDRSSALAHAELLLHQDPLDEAAHRQVMRLHVAAGHRARALRAWHECVSTLGRELGVRPSPETVALYEELVNEAGPVVTWEQPRTDALVGRQAEWERLVGCWQRAARGRCSFALVRGEAGIGKSRLVDELRSSCAASGAATASSRAYEAEGALAHAPIVDLLRSDTLSAGWAGLDARWRAELARVLPELAHGARPGPAPASAGADDRTLLFEALRRAVLSRPGPLLLAVDDLQWCDRETLEFLHYLVRSSAAEPLLVVGTARDGELDDDHPLRRVLDGLAALDVLTDIALGPLDHGPARELARRLTGASDEAVDRLATASEGNPLFLVELARSDLGPGRAGSAGPSGALPPRVRSIIGSRLARLAEPARLLAGSASVVGRAFTVELLTGVEHGSDEAALVAALDELWRRGIVQDRGGDAYDFSHDLIRRAAYDDLGPARRARLHRRVAEALIELRAADLGSVAAQIAAHLERGGQPGRAVGFYRLAIERAAQVFAYGEVEALAGRALELVAHEPPGAARDERELSLLTPLGVAHHAGRGIDLPDALERANTLREELGMLPEPATLRLLTNSGIGNRDFVASTRWARRLLARARASGEDVLLTEAHYALGVSWFWRGRVAVAHAHLSRALGAYREERHAEHVRHFGQDPSAVCLVRLAWTSWRLGCFGEVDELVRRGLERADGHGHPYTAAYVRLFAAWLALDAGEVARMEALVAGIDQSKVDHRWAQATAALFDAWAEACRRGDEAGVAGLEHAVADLHEPPKLLMEPLALLLLARARAGVGDLGAAVDAAAVARAIAQREMPVVESESCRLHGELLAASGGAPAEVGAALRRAVAVAVRQRGVPDEARARASLARWSGGAEAAEQRQAIEELRRRFGSGGPLSDDALERWRAVP